MTAFYFWSSSKDGEQKFLDPETGQGYEGYVAAIPQYGPLIHIQEITVSYEKDTATGTLKNDLASKIMAPQDVILYDKDHFVLPLGGKVKEVKQEDNSSIVTITLPQETNTDLLSSTVGIITLETSASKRLPLSALQTDENNAFYVWMMEQKEDSVKSNVRRQYINVGMQDDKYFEEAGQEIGSFDLVLINPDKKVKSNKRYKIEQVIFEAPLNNPIKEAWTNFEVTRLEQQQVDLLQAAEDCRNGKLNTAQQDTSGEDTAAASSCNSPFPATTTGTDPFAVFNALTNKQGVVAP